jgi:hypothetical protein
VGAIHSFNRAGWSLSLVAIGDRKDLLQFLRMVHFLRKCTMRKNCNRDTTEAKPLLARDYYPHGLFTCDSFSGSRIMALVRYVIFSLCCKQ